MAESSKTGQCNTIATENTAIASIEADFSAAGRFTDSFALVKDGEAWKIVAKVYHAIRRRDASTTPVLLEAKDFATGDVL